ncbi:serine/threonine-protein kinase [Rhodopirellula maiorica SM1]|uniref:Serine/threonine-protein kinase n=1 Tax=Rhodopirellula maiorica SM1 TaxID=1265738 RepID=M5R7P0_9BACT|nr:protein kinase [Rhodopirellula maiorica]EMI15400.1 serine/threonine-protein kinase [Rhodopirellula maiorica SM1]
MANQSFPPNPDSGDEIPRDSDRQNPAQRAGDNPSPSNPSNPTTNEDTGRNETGRKNPDHNKTDPHTTQDDAAIDETIPIDDDSVSPPNVVQSGGGTDANVDPSALTEQIEQTIDMDEVQPSSNANQKTQSDNQDRTLSAADLEQTLEVDDAPTGTRDQRSAPRPGGSSPPPNHTVAIGAIPQPDAKEAPQEQSAEKPVASVMTSREIGATINPRELSDEDAVMWDSIAKSETHRNEPSQLAPAIERSLRETNLRIVPRNVTKGQSTGSDASDYQLVRMLGKGGMGNVYVAKQESLDRMIAVKIIRPLDREKREKLQTAGRLADVEQNRRQQFLSEAVVTGDLDHPNIVPIHDIAVMGNDTLFYAMKRVIGTPWNKVIAKKTRDENLEILLKVADAVGFAHTRGVVHRDIKPENIMLGDFGVVMVMDWGLALPTEAFEKHDSVFPVTGLGGTPAFMAPEMATGPISRVTVRSDVYLLGATLFMIITGEAPHHGSNVRECLKAVANNVIREVGPTHQGELMDIALKAMATNPLKRYPDVPAFQQAIRDYRSHAESIALTTRASDDFAKGVESKRYADLSRAIYGFQEAITLWEGNRRAAEGLERSTLQYAEIAFNNEDYDNAIQLLDPANAAHAELLEKVNNAIRERATRQRRFRWLRRAAVAMLIFILIGSGVATWIIYGQKQVAVGLMELANREKELTKQASDELAIALKQTQASEAFAQEQKRIANTKTREAEEKTEIAITALQAETDAKKRR